MQREEANYLSLEEVRTKLSCLSKADFLRLRKVAGYQAMKLRDGDEEDLLAEGLQRVISGVRRWPRGLDTIPFMTNIFASIISSNAKHSAIASQYEVDAEVDQSGNVDSALYIATLEGHDNSVEVIYAQEMLEKLTTDLSDDPEALAVAMALGEGLTAIEAQSQFRLSQKQYDAARKRFRRVVNRITTMEKIA